MGLQTSKPAPAEYELVFAPTMRELVDDCKHMVTQGYIPVGAVTAMSGQYTQVMYRPPSEPAGGSVNFALGSH